MIRSGLIDLTMRKHAETKMAILVSDLGLYAVSLLAREVADRVRPWWGKNRDKILWERRK